MRLIKLPEVMEKTTLSRATIYRFMSEGRFPTQITLGVKSVSWIEEEIDQWIMQRLQHRKT
ncbi:AlpA family transcriptional regulator [Vibrio sp. TBV020]|uniref:AlpA family transcriptional regulator n=1 Tax=Vibrio sp. TBV020 TaxID=3137398 RepID=UPI0038CD7B0A